MESFGRTDADHMSSDSERIIVSAGLVAGRHDGMPVNEFIFQVVPDKDVQSFEKMDRTVTLFLLQKGLLERDSYGDLRGCMGKELRLYVTGLAAASASVIRLCCQYHIPLSLMHYSKAKKGYKRQQIVA